MRRLHRLAQSTGTRWPSALCHKPPPTTLRLRSRSFSTRSSHPSPLASSLPTFSHLLFDHSPSEHVVSITLNRPSVHNAFDDDLIAELKAAFTHPLLTSEASSPSAPRAVLLRSTGPSFSAGADLQWMKRMKAYTREGNVKDATALFDMLHAIATCPVPVIARVQGSAYGAASASSPPAMSPSASPPPPSHSPKSSWVCRLPRSPPSSSIRMGAGASRWLLTGEKFPASTAVRLGLLSDVADSEAELDTAVQQVVRSLQSNGPEAVRKTKRLIGRVSGLEERLAEVKRYTVELIADIRVSAEGQDGISSFLERRPPQWKAKHSER